MDQQRETRVEEGSRGASAAERVEPAADADTRPSDPQMRPSEAEMRPDERAPTASHNLDAGDVRSHWISIQASFVDDPMGAVQQADELTGAIVEQLSARHHQLRDEVGRASDSESQTELARKSLQKYRALLQGLIGMDFTNHRAQATAYQGYVANDPNVSRPDDRSESGGAGGNGDRGPAGVRADWRPPAN